MILGDLLGCDLSFVGEFAAVLGRETQSSATVGQLLAQLAVVGRVVPVEQCAVPGRDDEVGDIHGGRRRCWGQAEVQAAAVQICIWQRWLEQPTAGFNN